MKSAPSSTSSSDPAGRAPGRGAILLLLLVCAAFAFALEAASRAAFPRLDRGHGAVVEERRRAVEIAPATDRRRTLLLLGNSLLDAGIRLEDVDRSLRPAWEVRRFMVVDTSALDWLYGIRRLLAEGARPDAIYLAMSPRQLVATNVRGEYFARQLMATRDALDAARAVGLDRTKTSSLAFASVSEFYGTRSEIRKDILVRLLPDLPGLMALLTRVDSKRLEEDVVRRAAESRLRALKAEAEREGARFALVLMPSAGPDEEGGSVAVLEAAKAAGVDVLRPAAGARLEETDFRDGFHLTSRGAEKLTASFIRLLGSRLLDETETAATGPGSSAAGSEGGTEPPAAR